MGGGSGVCCVNKAVAVVCGRSPWLTGKVLSFQFNVVIWLKWFESLSCVLCAAGTQEMGIGGKYVEITFFEKCFKMLKEN